MSHTQTPLDTMFELQRTAIKQNQKAVEQTLDLQKQALSVFSSGLKQSAATREQTADVTKTGIDMYFDAIEAAVPGNVSGLEQLRANVHEQLDTAGELNDEAWENVETLFEQNVESYEEFAATYETMVGDSFDALLSATEYVEEQTSSATEAIETQIEQSE